MWSLRNNISSWRLRRFSAADNPHSGDGIGAQDAGDARDALDDLDTLSSLRMSCAGTCQVLIIRYGRAGN